MSFMSPSSPQPSTFIALSAFISSVTISLFARCHCLLDRLDRVDHIGHRLRFAVPRSRADATKILHLLKSLADFERRPPSIISLTVPQLLRDLDHSKYDCILYDICGITVGMALFYNAYSTTKGRSLYLTDLFVYDNQRRKGID